MDQSFCPKNCLDWYTKSTPTNRILKRLRQFYSNYATTKENHFLFYKLFFSQKIMNKKTIIEQVIELNILYNQKNIDFSF